MAVAAGISPGFWLNLVFNLLDSAPELGKSKPVEILSRVLSWLLFFLAGLFLQGFISDIEKRKERKLRSTPMFLMLSEQLGNLLDFAFAYSFSQAFNRIPREWNELADVKRDEKRKIQMFGERFGQRDVLLMHRFHFFREHLQSGLPLRSMIPELISIVHDAEGLWKDFESELKAKQFDIDLLPKFTGVREAYVVAKDSVVFCRESLQLLLTDELNYTPEEVKQLWSEADHIIR